MINRRFLSHYYNCIKLTFDWCHDFCCFLYRNRITTVLLSTSNLIMIIDFSAALGLETFTSSMNTLWKSLIMTSTDATVNHTVGVVTARLTARNTNSSAIRYTVLPVSIQAVNKFNQPVTSPSAPYDYTVRSSHLCISVVGGCHWQCIYAGRREFPWCKGERESIFHYK